VNRVSCDDLEDKKWCVIASKVDLFANIAERLGDVVAILVPPDGAVEMVDDALVLEAAVPVLPSAPAVHPEDGIFFGNDHFGQAVIRVWWGVVFHWMNPIPILKDFQEDATGLCLFWQHWRSSVMQKATIHQSTVFV